MRGVRAALGVALSVVVIGCQSSPGKVFSAEIPAIDGDLIGSIDIVALPVSLRDSTGSVTSLVALPFHLMEWEGGDIGGGRADPVPNAPQAVQILWLGGACERNVDMRLEAEGDALVLTVHANSSLPILGGACPALGVGRSVILEFAAPVDPTDIDVRTDLG